MKRSDLLKMILGLLLGAIGLMLYKAFSVPNMPELASSSNLEVERGGTAILTVNVEDDCTANWYTQEVGGEPFQEKIIAYRIENIQDNTTYYVEAVSEKNARKVSRKRLKIEVKLKEKESIAETPVTETEPEPEPEPPGPPRPDNPPIGDPPPLPDPVNDDQDRDGIKDDVDECPSVKGVGELNGCPYEKINLSIVQNTNDHNSFSFNPKIWNAITDNTITFEFTCDCNGLNKYTKPIVVVDRGKSYGRFNLDSENRYVGAIGTVKVKVLTKNKKYEISGMSSSFTKKLSCSSQ